VTVMFTWHYQSESLPVGRRQGGRSGDAAIRTRDDFNLCSCQPAVHTATVCAVTATGSGGVTVVRPHWHVPAGATECVTCPGQCRAVTVTVTASGAAQLP
jgi:hypothetical protein